MASMTYSAVLPMKNRFRPERDTTPMATMDARSRRAIFGITSFGITAWTGQEVGERIINEHDEADENDRSEELYLVTQGRAVFELDGERRDAPAGTFVYVEPDVKRTAFAEEAGTTIVAIGGVPGKAYEPSGWEVWAPFQPLYEAATASLRLRLRRLSCISWISGR